jgi:UDP-glucose 4-epimerase
MKFEKVLVTGAGGMLGQAVVKELSGHCRVTGFDIRQGDAPIDWKLGDLTDAAAVAEAVKGQDAIIQIAAIPNIWSGNGETIMRVNVVGLWNVLEAAENAGVRRVVICSSDSVVGFTVREGAMQPPVYLPVDVDHPTRPTDPYALSKLLGEEMGRSFAARGKLEIVVLRPVFVAYPQMYGEIAARSRNPDAYKGPMVGGPSSAGGGPCWHQVDPRDAARAFRNALEIDGVSYERFFLCGRVTLHPEPTLDRLRQVLGGRLPEVRDTDLYRRNPFAPLYDLTAARDRLGFEAEYDARDVSLLKVPV